jgi:hypothetical protein
VPALGLSIALVLLGSLGCAGPEPMLKSNKQLLLYGKEMAGDEVARCQRKAEAAGLHHGTNRSGNAGAGAVIGVVAGAAVGASSGLVGGPTGVAIGAAVGGAVGGILGLVAGAYKPLDPQPDYTRFVDRCLKEKGYEVEGWQ